ncbi:serine/threonine protein kinase [Cylindrospermum stagnale PCC 7417]|uniref:non-specific serine/threonine protein kinase n=1 Tax=Cylindrospermum stagnale PCC 7417 TaxID=56107 RepID=K9WU82_9NOST|nr:serine/threonine protein kinase [Cylindrospermum stagnale PCC 7417]
MMICCLNPECHQPLNPDSNKFCQACSTPLVPLLINRFRVLRVLSNEGGFGKTYLAEDTHKLNETCVIKQLAPKQQGTWALKKAMELFAQEAKRLQDLGEHPQIPTLFAYFEENNFLYLVQQFIAGDNLLNELAQSGKYNESQIQELLLDLLPPLKFVHERHVIHRDIKPENIMRRKSDGKLVLIDFGASKQLTVTVHTQIGTQIGSHGYSPLEQIKSGEAYPASDLFALGATCFHLLTGVHPFELWAENGYAWVNNWRQHLSISVSGELGKVIDKLLKKDIHERYQSADEVIHDLSPKAPQQVSLPLTISAQVNATPPQLQIKIPIVPIILNKIGNFKNQFLLKPSVLRLQFRNQILPSIVIFWLKFRRRFVLTTIVLLLGLTGI